MKNTKYTTLVFTILFCCMAAAAGHAQGSTQNNDQTTNNPAAEDRMTNDRTVATADQQKENELDRSITQRIRKLVVGDKSLSTYAHNVKIVSEGGTVTLKGPVKSTREKDSVIKKAVSVTGSQDKVVDQISVKGSTNR